MQMVDASEITIFRYGLSAENHTLWNINDLLFSSTARKPVNIVHELLVHLHVHNFVSASSNKGPMKIVLKKLPHVGKCVFFRRIFVFFFFLALVRFVRNLNSLHILNVTVNNVVGLCLFWQQYLHKNSGIFVEYFISFVTFCSRVNILVSANEMGELTYKWVRKNEAWR